MDSLQFKQLSQPLQDLYSQVFVVRNVTSRCIIEVKVKCGVVLDYILFLFLPVYERGQKYL